MPNEPNITNIPSNRVEIVDPRTGMVSREWYRFFLNLFNLAGNGGNQTSLDDLQIGPPPQPDAGGGGGGSGTVTSVDVSGGTTGLTTSGGPITTSGTISLAGTLNVANGGTGATTAAGAPFALKGANSDITSMTGITGGISSPDFVQFDTAYATPLTAGQLGWDGNNTLGLGMAGGNVTQHIGEDQFFYCKATAAIAKGEVVMFTGAVGASGVPTGAPATGITDGTYIMGIAAEAIALNAFGLVQAFGTLRNVNTSGYADGDILWYDPAVTGGLTKTKPVAPNVKVQMAAVINGGSAGGGTILIRIDPGSTLGGTDSNAQIGTPSNGQIITYDGTNTYWKNTALTAGTGISVTASATGVLTIANTSPSSGGTVTSVAMSVPTGLTVSGSPITTSGTLAVSYTAGYSIPTDASQANWNTAFSERLQWDGGATNLVAATGRTSLGGTTVGQNMFTLANPSAVTFPRFNADNTISALSASAFRTAIGAGTGDGTITSVTGTSPVVSSGGTTPAISLASGYGDTQNPYASKTANWFLAAPNGTAGAPTFRAIVAADVPTLNQNTTGTASNVTGVVAVANGGSGQTTAQAAMNTFAGATTSGQYLRGNGTNVVMSAIQAADVPTLNQNTTGTASNVTGTVAIANGGTGQTTKVAAFDALSPLTTKGDLIGFDGVDNVRLGVGTNNQVLTADSTTATGLKWATPSGGSSNITALGLWENNATISANYSITSGNNGMSAGPITVASGVTVTVPSGSSWAVV